MLSIIQSFCDQAEVATTMFKKWPQMATFMVSVWPFLAKLNHKLFFLFAISKEEIERYNIYILKNEKNLFVGLNDGKQHPLNCRFARAASADRPDASAIIFVDVEVRRKPLSFWGTNGFYSKSKTKVTMINSFLTIFPF